jgi:hypothetical protein
MDNFIATLIGFAILFLISMFLFLSVTTIISIYQYNYLLGNDVVVLLSFSSAIAIILYAILLNQEDSEVKI